MLENIKWEKIGRETHVSGLKADQPWLCLLCSKPLLCSSFSFCSQSIAKALWIPLFSNMGWISLQNMHVGKTCIILKVLHHLKKFFVDLLTCYNFFQVNFSVEITNEGEKWIAFMRMYALHSCFHVVNRGFEPEMQGPKASRLHGASLALLSHIILHSLSLCGAA